ncbi:hypothetical protein ONZ43_g3965 [Nemania bipapillata]|uniref:Uncharacterized protein n=1 Tax=Nemania bipapillata TaxID=110536 RepID=A0ACC2ITR8_9PEZI|nr:hypothetical protein ONZ43_g3965 [Nemania bipapillata]
MVEHLEWEVQQPVPRLVVGVAHAAQFHPASHLEGGIAMRAEFDWCVVEVGGRGETEHWYQVLGTEAGGPSALEFAALQDNSASVEAYVEVYAEVLGGKRMERENSVQVSMLPMYKEDEERALGSEVVLALDLVGLALDSSPLANSRVAVRYLGHATGQRERAVAHNREPFGDAEEQGLYHSLHGRAPLEVGYLAQSAVAHLQGALLPLV